MYTHARKHAGAVLQTDGVTGCWPGSVSLNIRKDKTSWSSSREQRGKHCVIHH